VTHEEVAQKYIDDVLATPSPYVTCDWTKKACARQRADLLRQGQENFPYVWEPDAGATVVDFIACLTHLKGEFAGKPFILAAWQVFAIMCAFSWKRKDDTKLRRYRRFTLQCGKSSGKTTLSAALCLYMLAADGERGSEVVTAARATAQARLTFDTARDTCRANPKLCEAFGLRILQHSIVQPSTASTMLPVSAQGRSLAGKIIHYGSCDETWLHRDREVYSEISLGCDKRNNSMLVSIGHCGESLQSVGYELYVTATKILSGELPDERTFALIYDASGYVWESDEAILASNPNAGVSSYLETIKEARNRALAIPSLQPAYKSHLLCLWSDGSESRQWISKEVLSPCREKNVRMEDFRLWHVGEHEGVTAPDMLRPFVVGMERSSLQERAAVIFCCKTYLAGVEHFYLFSKYYDSAANDDEALADSILAHYRNHIGYGVTEHDDDGFALKALAHDSWVAPSPRLEKCGISPLPFAKTARTFSPVMDWAMSLALVGRLHFGDDDEILSASLLGIHAHRDLNNNLFPRRANPDRPIDAAIAALYAMRLAMAPGMLNPPEVSDVKAIFLMEDGSVSESSPNGLIQTHGPLR